jgi:hypothetical protein
MYKTFTLLIFLISINCLAQNDYQLKVKVSGNMPAFEYIINIHRNSQNTKIYFLEYTGKEKFSKADKIRVQELFDKKDRTTNERIELENLFNNSKIFSKECFMYSANSSIIILSDSIIRSKEAILSEIEKNKNRVVLDANQVEVTIKNKNGVEYSYHIHAPDNEHYKLFDQFVIESWKEFEIK